MWETISSALYRPAVMLGLALAGSLFFSGRSCAHDDAKVVGPYLDELTLAVCKVRSDRLDLAPTFKRLAELVPDSAATFENAARKLNERCSELCAVAQGQPVYGVVPGAMWRQGVPWQAWGLLVGDWRGKDQQGRPVLPLIEQSRMMTLLIPSPSGELPAERPAAHPVPRPEFDAARQAVAEWPIQLLVAPPPHARRVVEEMLPELPQVLGGGSSRVLTEGFLWAAVGADPQEVAATIVIQSQSPDAAAALAEWLPGVVRRLAGVVNAQVSEGQRIPEPDIEALVKAATPVAQGDRVVLQLHGHSQAARILAPHVYAVFREFEGVIARNETSQKMKHLAVALHNFADVYKQFPPPPKGRDDAGQPLLSWRVHLLPFLELNELYEQFHLNEPWDSPHNLKLLDKMPELFRSPGSGAQRGFTTFLVPIGEDTVFGGTKPVWFSAIKDGTSNTIFLVDVKDELAAPWTAPRDYQFDPQQPGAGLRDVGGKFLAALFDGSVRTVPLDLGNENILHLFQKADGHPVHIPEDGVITQLAP